MNITFMTFIDYWIACDSLCKTFATVLGYIILSICIILSKTNKQAYP